MAEINSYLTFNGNTEAAFNLYRSVFGSEFSAFQRFKDTPHGGNMPDADKEKIMHIALPVGNGILMGSDSLESMGHTLTIGDNFSIGVTPADEDEAYKIFNGLADGGHIIMPLEKVFWGALFGMLTDKFGIKWMVNLVDK